MIVHSSCLHDTIRVMTDKRSIAELSKVPVEGIKGRTYYFNRIKVLPEHEGTGEGKELMIEVCRYADDLNAIIYNPLNPYGKRNMESLIKFFEASGFKMYKHNSMIRNPNTKSNSNELSSKKIYTITTVESAIEDGYRSVGYAYDFKTAETWLIENILDINESGSYPFAVIEPLLEGIYMHPYKEYWYEWNCKKNGYEPCEKPVNFKQIIGWSLG